jgi:hypothetical protein
LKERKEKKEKERRERERAREQQDTVRASHSTPWEKGGREKRCGKEENKFSFYVRRTTLGCTMLAIITALEGGMRKNCNYAW